MIIMTSTEITKGHFANGKWIEEKEPAKHTTLKVVSKPDDYTRVYLNDIQLGLRSINIEQSGRNFMLIDLALAPQEEINVEIEEPYLILNFHGERYMRLRNQ